jgi:hypothetical protein
MGSSPDMSNDFFQFTYSFQSHYGPRVDSASNKNEYQKIFLGSKARPAGKANNLTAISNPVNILIPFFFVIQFIAILPPKPMSFRLSSAFRPLN